MVAVRVELRNSSINSKILQLLWDKRPSSIILTIQLLKDHTHLTVRLINKKRSHSKTYLVGTVIKIRVRVIILLVVEGIHPVVKHPPHFQQPMQEP